MNHLEVLNVKMHLTLKKKKGCEGNESHAVTENDRCPCGKRALLRPVRKGGSKLVKFKPKPVG